MTGPRPDAYVLGVDLGTTYAAAAVATGGSAELVTLGHSATSIPSVVHVAVDGSVIVGDAAVRRGASEPEGIVRDFKRRVGDPVPVVVHGRPYPTEVMLAELIRHVVAAVQAERGGPPARLVLTHPANWGAYKQDVLVEAARLAGHAEVLLLPEPTAAAIHYASTGHVPDGATVAVYDFGGGTFDAVVLARRGQELSVVGQPHGVDRLGGVDIDEVVLQLALAGAGVDPSAAALDGSTAMAVAALRRDVIEAKEALSSDTTTTLRVLVPPVDTVVRLTRAELESLIAPLVDRSITALEQAVTGAGLTPAALQAVLLVGGSSRIPMVGSRLVEVLGVRVVVDAHPKHVVALGAAAHGMASLPVAAVSPAGAVPAPPPSPVLLSAPAFVPPAGPLLDATDGAGKATRGRGRRRVWIVGGLAAAAVAAVAGVVVTRDEGNANDVSTQGFERDETDSTSSDEDTTATTEGTATSTGGGDPGDGSSSLAGLAAVLAVDGDTDCDATSSSRLASGLAEGPDGTVYLAEFTEHLIRAVEPDGTVRILAGTGVEGGSGDGGPAQAAELANPTALAVDEDGGVLVVDRSNERVRRIAPDGTIDTVLGGGDQEADGVDALDFDLGGGGSGLALDPEGRLHVSTNDRVVRVEHDGSVTTVLGAIPDGPVVGRSIETADAMTFDDRGGLVVEIGHQLVTVDEVVAGTGSPGFAGDGGAATVALLCGPSTLAAAPGVLFVGDAGNDRVRAIAEDGTIRTVVGHGGDDGERDATRAEHLRLIGVSITAGSDGTLVVATSSDLMRIGADGTVTLVAELP